MKLYINSHNVGFATIKEDISKHKGRFSRVLHNTDLAGLEKSHQHLIVITKITVLPEFVSTPIPFECPGVEGTPMTLGDAHHSAFYPWCAFDMATEN